MISPAFGGEACW